MSLHDHYKHLLQRPYVAGKHDCYGLVRDFVQDIYGVKLTNFARPLFFWEDPDPKMNFINQFMTHDGWEPIGLHSRNLRMGDGLIFAVRGGHANHVGVYAGNGLFLHHFYQRFSREEPFNGAWSSRLLQIVRHPDVTKARETFSTQFEVTHATRSQAPASSNWP